MARHTPEARKMRRDLDLLLAAVGEETGIELAWDTTELAVIDLIMAGITRKQALNDEYDAATEPKVRVKIACELRLLEAHLARLYKQIRPQMADPVSRRSSKARAAANVRWNRAVG
jgi:hypothetical protein